MRRYDVDSSPYRVGSGTRGPDRKYRHGSVPKGGHHRPGWCTVLPWCVIISTLAGVGTVSPEPGRVRGGAGGGEGSNWSVPGGDSGCGKVQGFRGGGRLSAGQLGGGQERV